MGSDRKRILIVGGGVAALEACLGLHLDDSIDSAITLVNPSRSFVYRPLEILTPFGRPSPPTFLVEDIVDGAVDEVIFDSVTDVNVPASIARTTSGRVVDFDAAIIATGTRSFSELDNAIIVGRPESMERLSILVAQIDAGMVDHVVFAVPSGPAWSIPIYELAMFTAERAKHHLREVEVTLITPQNHPMIEFGRAASDHVTKLLAENGVELLRGTDARDYRDEVLTLRDGRRIETRFVVALPELRGVPIPGLPHDRRGFLPVDGFGRVKETPNIFAAGDITDFPIKQGGMASQQADVVVGAVTEYFGGRAALHPFEPELRGLLLSPNRHDFISATGNEDEENYESSPASSVKLTALEKISSNHLSARLSQLAETQISVN